MTSESGGVNGNTRKWFDQQQARQREDGKKEGRSKAAKVKESYYIVGRKRSVRGQADDMGYGGYEKP